MASAAPRPSSGSAVAAHDAQYGHPSFSKPPGPKVRTDAIANAAPEPSRSSVTAGPTRAKVDHGVVCATAPKNAPAKESMKPSVTSAARAPNGAATSGPIRQPQLSESMQTDETPTVNAAKSTYTESDAGSPTAAAPRTNALPGPVLRAALMRQGGAALRAAQPIGSAARERARSPAA